MTNATLPIEHIWRLYDLQNEFIGALAKRSWTGKFKEYMKKQVGSAARLLATVREQYSGYVGGDEVLQAIADIQMDVKRRIGEI